MTGVDDGVEGSKIGGKFTEVDGAGVVLVVSKIGGNVEVVVGSRL